MPFIAVCNSKGGVGKTTIAAALAVRAAQDSARVAMVDLDPQLSLVEWWARRGKTDNPTILEGPETATDAVERLQQTGWDWAFLDGPPAFTDLIEEMIQVADFVVVPVKPTTADLLATEDAVALAKAAGTHFLIVLNDVDSKVFSDRARALLAKAKLPVADAEISHRVSHQRGMNAGKSAAEARDPTAASEIDAVWEEVKRAASKAARAKQKRESRS